MKKYLFTCLLSFFIFQGFAQKNAVISDSLGQKILLSVDTAKIKTEEFVWFFNKYNSYLDSSLIVDLEESMEYFIEYKMKIIEAERRQLDTTTKFKDEFYSYIKSTANSYIFDDKVETNFKKLEYDRFANDYNISHIFIRCDKKSNPKDTLLAYQKALKIKNELLAGANFESYVTKYSEDSFTKENGGKLGFITAMQLPLEYENAVFVSKPGDILGPICTKQGYYITKVNDKRASLGQAKASIIVIYPEAKDDAGWAKAKQRIDSVYARLQAGESFEQLSDIYNTNQKLKQNKGSIGWFDNSVKYDSKLKEAIFSLEKIGDYSQPIQFVEYGYVICKITEKDKILPFETYEKIISKAIKNDESRKDLAKKTFYSNYKKQCGYKEYSGNISEYITLVDNSILLGKWAIPTFAVDKPLIKIADSIYTYKDFSNYLYANQKDKGISDKGILVRTKLEDFSYKMLEQKAIQQLPSTNKEFALVMQEYHDGMIIYELLNNEIFSKSSSDTVGLQNFYNENKNNYTQDESAIITYYYCKNEKVLKKLIPLIKKQQTEYFSDQFILNTLNKKEMDNIVRDTMTVFKGTNSFIDSLQWQKGTYHILENNKVMVFSDIIPVTVLPLDKCKNQVISDYQDYLEKEWLYYLHKKYSYSINQAVFDELHLKVSK